MASAEETVRQFWKCMEEEGSPTAFKKFLHPDIVKEDSGLGKTIGLEMALVGLDVYLEVFKRPYVKAEIRNLAVNGNTVLLERTEHNINRETGDVYTGDLMAVMVVDKDGKITRWADYYDPTPYKYGKAMPRSESVGKLIKMWNAVNRKKG